MLWDKHQVKIVCCPGRNWNVIFVSIIPIDAIEQLSSNMLTDELICSELQCWGSSSDGARSIWERNWVVWLQSEGWRDSFLPDRSADRSHCSFVEPSHLSTCRLGRWHIWVSTNLANTSIPAPVIPWDSPTPKFQINPSCFQWLFYTACLGSCCGFS